MTIKGLRFCEETSINPRGNGDNWHTTWAANGTQYTGLCDGSGFAECPECDDLPYNSRIFIIDGQPGDFRFKYMRGYPDLKMYEGFRPKGFSQHFGFGILALNDTEIYQFLSVPRYLEDGEHCAFVAAKLIYSPNDGETWYNRDMAHVHFEYITECSPGYMMFNEEGDGAFSLISILQMGQNYSWNTDGYVYIYAPNGNSADTMKQLVMARVPTDKIKDRDAYEFFVSRSSGGAKWSCDINKREPVHFFPEGWVNTARWEGSGAHPYSWHPSLIYNKPLNKYMMLNWGMGAGENNDWFEKPSYLGCWVADYPWGPWEQIHENKEWLPRDDSGARAYQPQFMPAWLAPDGKSFYMAWTDFRQESPVGSTYAYQQQRVEIIVE
jgi:hypothetical protein